MRQDAKNHAQLNNQRQAATPSDRNRQGAVLVEFALCAPILFFFFFTAFEFSRVNMIRQSIENAAYEGSRRGIVPGATAEDCKNAARVVLNSISARVATVNVIAVGDSARHGRGDGEHRRANQRK